MGLSPTRRCCSSEPPPPRALPGKPGSRRFAKRAHASCPTPFRRPDRINPTLSASRAHLGLGGPTDGRPASVVDTLPLQCPRAYRPTVRSGRIALRMQNAKCRMQNGMPIYSVSAFRILHTELGVDCLNRHTDRPVGDPCLVRLQPDTTYGVDDDATTLARSRSACQRSG